MVQMAQDRLTRFFALGENVLAFAQATGEPIAAILSWLAQPIVADTIARFHAAQDAARTQAALNTLHRLAIESPDPTEQRRAATTLLRHSRPASPVSSPPKSLSPNPAPSRPVLPRPDAMPQPLVPACPPISSNSTPDASNRLNGNTGNPNSNGNTGDSSLLSATAAEFQLAILELHRPEDLSDFTFNPALAIYLPLPDHFPEYPAHLSLGPDADFFAFTTSLKRLSDSS